MLTEKDFQIGDMVFCESNHKSGVVLGFHKLDAPLLKNSKNQQNATLIVMQASKRLTHLLPGNCIHI